MSETRSRPIQDRDPIDQLLAVAAALLDMPVAAIAMEVDGIRILRSLKDGFVTERDYGKSGEPFLEMDPGGDLVITDLTTDVRTRDHPFVRSPYDLRFYAGAEVTDGAGERIGSLCVLDVVARPRPDDRLMRLLRMLADQAGGAVLQARLVQAQAEKAELLGLAESLLGLGHWRFDFRTGQIDWSDQVYRIHGVDKESFTPGIDDALSAYHPDDRAVISAHVATARQTGQGYDCQLRLQRADGHARLTHSTGRCLFDDNGVPVALFGVFQDITDRHLAEQKLRESEERFRLLATNASDIIATYGVDGVFTYVSPSVFAALGYQPDELVGQSVSTVIHPDDVRPTWAAFAEHLAAPEGTPAPRIPYRALGRDGEVRWVEAHPTIIRNAEGLPVLIQDLVRDVSAAKELESTLIVAREQAERAAEAKSDFLANMSHEIRTPLTAILGFSSLLNARRDIPEDAQSQIGRIMRAGEALLSLVNDVLDFSKLEAGQFDVFPEPTDPRALCHDALLMFSPVAQKKGLALEFEEGPDLADCVDLDPARVRQILFNLIGNATKFTDEGSVGLRVDYDRESEALHVAVRDTGSGMDEAQCSRLFQRFSQVDTSSTRRHGGTGLGLAICSELAALMGGRVSVTSIPGEGSVFTLSIPAPERRSELSAPATSEAQHAALEGLRVMVVDDHAANREIVAAILAPVGVEVSLFGDVDQALTATAGLPFDVILMDLRMPGMSGREAAGAIRAGYGPNRATPILAFSADVAVGADDLLVFDGHVSKPIVPAVLLDAVTRVVGGSQLPLPSAEKGRNAS